MNDSRPYFNVQMRRMQALFSRVTRQTIYDHDHESILFLSWCIFEYRRTIAYTDIFSLFVEPLWTNCITTHLLTLPSLAHF